MSLELWKEIGIKRLYQMLLEIWKEIGFKRLYQRTHSTEMAEKRTHSTEMAENNFDRGTVSPHRLSCC